MNETGDSPFALRKQEVLMRDIVTDGHFIALRALQEAIILSINNMLIATSRMVTKYLELYGYDIEQNEIQKNIKILVENEYLDACRFTCENNISSYKIYNVGFRGKVWLRACREGIRNSTFMATGDVESIKKVLSMNQCYIGLGFIKNYTYSVCRQINDRHKVRSQYLKNYGMAIGENDVIVMEAIRKTDNYIEEMKKKHHRILNEVINNNEGFGGKTKNIIYIAEDEGMMIEIMKVFTNTKTENKRSIWFTYDRKLIEDNENKLYKFKTDSI